MRRRLAACLAALAWAWLTAAQADTLSGEVVVVIDGDTVLFRPGDARAARAFIKVRLVDIDAPESDQPYGEAATDWLAARVLKRRVALERVATDSYGRTLGRLVKDGVDVNAELVRAGLAWAAARGARREGLRELQREAQRARRGLWQDAAAAPPWVWRRTASGRAGN